MKLTIDGKNVDIRNSKIKLNTNSLEAHQQAQFIEKYFRALFADKLDMSKIHFYSGAPSNAKNEISADAAMDLLQTGYPLFVKHENVENVMPFVKRRNADDSFSVHTGRNILDLRQHERPDIDFDFESFKNEEKPPKPGFFSNLLMTIGLKKKDEVYTNYHEYVRKSKIIERNKEAIDKYESEIAAYKIAKEVDEGKGLPEYISEMDKENPEAVVEDTYAKEVDLDNVLNIDEIRGPEPKGPKDYPPERAEDDPLLPPDEAEELLSRDRENDTRKRLSGSEFMGKVKNEIRGKNLDDEKVYKQVLENLEETRQMHMRTGKISTKEYIEHARVLMETEEKRSYANRNADVINAEKRNYSLLSEKEYNSLADESKHYFVKYHNGNYIERTYLITRKHLEKNDPKEVIKDDVKVDMAAEKEILNTYKDEDKQKIKAILKNVSSNREAEKNRIANVITDQLIDFNKNLDREKTLQTVRYGYTFRSLTSSAQSIERCADYAKEPKKIRNYYTKELKRSENAIFTNFKGEPKKVENAEAEKVENAKIEKPEVHSAGLSM